ncbi:MAG: AAA family ATPase [Anaerolineae bacterium]|nr:AAA family ATPase [Anaerolineae bacterium]
MRCPVCQTLNREHARFCKECGTFLASLCPQCRRELPDDAKFCDACGFALPGQPPAASPAAPSPAVQVRPVAPPPPSASPQTWSDFVPSTPPPAAPPAITSEQARLQQYIPKELLKKLNAAISGGGLTGERRVVTMLFCDVKGSTAAAEQLDPEEWTDIINGAFEHMIKPVYKFEGTVARLMGDSILAFFGAPIAHEDDPERAVLGGLEIVNGISAYKGQVKQQYGFDLDVRVGINTGMVVVGTVGSDLRMEYTAMGDAINLAARMEQTAQPGTVQISHDTYKLVAPLFQVEELGEIAVKGKEEPVLAYRVIRRRAEYIRVRGVAGLESKLVGRDLEMTMLVEILEKAQHGVGHIVCLMSEAGLGKTRLIEELHQVQQSSPALQWYALSSLSYEASHTYGMLQNLVRALQHTGVNDSPIEARRKLDPILAVLPSVDRERAAQALALLLGSPDESGLPPLEGEAFQMALQGIMQALVRETFRLKPGVLVIDDMHWSDTQSVVLLLSLLPLTRELPLVLLYSLRPDNDASATQLARKAEAELPHLYTELKLRPLSNRDSSLLVSTLLGGIEVPADLMDRILERALGNPFFIEEVVRTLIENGTIVRDEANGLWTVSSHVDTFDIPTSLQALLAARIDQLDEMTRRTLQLSAVIGRSFYVRVLAAIMGSSQDIERHLGILQQYDLIGEAARLPELEYRFRNPLTQEVAYETILFKERREFHRRVAETMETLYADHLDDYSGLLAHHFIASDLYGKAISYLHRAARRSAALYSYDEAIRQLSAALDLMPGERHGMQLKAELLEELADIYRLVRDFAEAISCYQQALALVAEPKGSVAVMPIRLHRKMIEVVTEAKWSVDKETYSHVLQIRQSSLANLETSLYTLAEEPPDAETVQLWAALSADAWRNQNPPEWETAQRFA